MSYIPAKHCRCLLVILLASALPAWQGIDVSECVVFDKFFRCAQSYWNGEDMVDRQFAAAIRFVLNESKAELCPLVRATAQVLSAELAVWLSRPLAEELAPGTARIQYEAEVGSYSYSILQAAMQNMALQASGVALVPYLGVFGRVTEELGRTLQLISTTSMIGAHAPLDAQQKKLKFRAAAQDRLWNEVWFPALLADPGPLWDAAAHAAVAPSQLEILSAPVEEVARQQEEALKTCFFDALDQLLAAQQRGTVELFWPHGSTLLALLRHGRLFGHFEDGHMDCVGDDVDFEVQLAETTDGAWPQFVREVAEALQHGKRPYFCYVGADVTELEQQHGRYEQLLCKSEVDGFTCPVSFFRASAGSDRAVGKCLAYTSEVPCPLNVTAHLSKYGGCVAMPNIELASLTIGNGCIEWMQTGLTPSHVKELHERSRLLADLGFVSMRTMWVQPACNSVAVSADGVALVGEAAGSRLESFYRSPNWGRAQKHSCIPVVRMVEDAPRCIDRVRILRSAMRLSQGRPGAVSLVVVLDGPTACCPPGVSVMESARDSVVLCVAPGPGNFTVEGHAGVYDEEALPTLCHTNPSILVLDPLPTPAGSHAVTLLLHHCPPVDFFITSAYLFPGLFEKEAEVVSSEEDVTIPGRSWTTYRVPW